MTLKAGFNTISVIGLGYIGLPTAAIIASRGVDVIGVDVNESVVETINRGEIHIVEPMLDVTVKGAVSSGHLKASLKPMEADAFLIAVPTPITDDKKSDISYVLSAAKQISTVLKKGDLVILESTSPVGTTEKLVEVLVKERPDLNFPKWDSKEACDVNIAYCPERVLPGKVVQELVSNDRSIGGLTDQCTKRATELYEVFVDGQLIGTDTRSAELCKLAENAFRDVNIAYANELANVCDQMDINVWEVIRLANRHPRVNILQPGPGVGGHCIAVDPWFIAESAPDDTPVIQASRIVNDGRPERIVSKIKDAVAFSKTKGIDHPVIALFGLAFKPNIDDLRESPAMEVALMTAQADFGEIIAVEPNITDLPSTLSKTGVTLAAVEKASEKADIAILLVNHAEFQNLDVELKKAMYYLPVCRDLI